ncbi:unnamed protein product, partial [marine sediment metagenome]
MRLKEKEFDRLKAIKKRNRKVLFNLPNVNGVGIGLKEVNGEKTDRIAIRVYTVKKVPRAQLKKSELVPTEIEGIVTDVIEIGEIRSLAGSEPDRVRPYDNSDNERKPMGQGGLDRLKEIKKRHSQELFNLPNVNGVGIGFKEVNGEVTDQIAIRVYVVKKVAGGTLGKDGLVPSRVEGTITDVIEIGEPRLLANDRPILMGGDGIGRCDEEIGAGTLGGACFYD